MKLKQLFCLIPFIESFLDFLSMVIKINKRMRKSLSVFTGLYHHKNTNLNRSHEFLKPRIQDVEH